MAMRSKYPILLALAAQAAAAALLALTLYLGAVLFQFKSSLYLAAAAQGLLAAALGHLLGLSRWWLAINLAFTPSLIVLGGWKIPPWSYLVGFLLLLLLNWNSFAGGVPLYLTGDSTRKKLHRLLDTRDPAFRFIDLGSGLAGTLYQLSRHYPHATFEGVETAPLVYLASWFRCLFRRNCRIRYRSLWKVDLSQYDIVYCFLSPVPMPALWQKAKAEMKNKSLLISNTFEIPGIPPQQEIQMKDWRGSKLLVWEL